MKNKSTNDAAKDTPRIVPFAMKNGFELASTAPPTIPSLVRGLLIEIGTSLLSADPKCGKSTLARQLIVDVAEGRDFLGMPTLCGDVVYLYLEGPLGLVAQHFQKLGHTGRRGQILVIDENMSKTKEESFRRLRENLRNLPNVRLIVVDPLSKLFRLDDSTSTDEVVPAMEQLEKFAKEHRVHVMALAHERKRKSEDRHQNSLGSVAFRGGSDTNLCLTKQGVERIISTEQRWGVELEPTFLKWDKERHVNTLDVTVNAVQEEQREKKDSKTLERIEKEIRFALLGKSTGLVTGEIVEAVTGKSTTILDVLEQMLASGEILAAKEGKANRYSLAPLPSIHLVAPKNLQPTETRIEAKEAA
jgi:RecA-family ATPase